MKFYSNVASKFEEFRHCRVWSWSVIILQDW